MHLLFPFLFGLCYGAFIRKTNSECYITCPAGYYKGDNCGENGKLHTCEICKNNTFADRPNNGSGCERCSVCRHLEEEIKTCLSTRDRECDCREGFYYFRDPSYGDCQPCPLKDCNETFDHRDCKRKCKSHTSTMGTLKDPTTTTRPSTTFTASTKTKSSNTPAITQLPAQSGHQMHWFYLVAVAIVTLLVLSWLLLLNRNPLRHLASCLCWGTNKGLQLPVEDPEQRSHQGCSPTTVTFSTFEETPMMALSHSPATDDHPTPAHVRPQEPNTEHQMSRQDEESEHWPAIVLYAIIKEVPLRRWKEFLRLLSVADQQLERVELEAGFGTGSIEKQYQMLRLWSQRPSASLDDIFSALHYMDLSGCAQQLQESLEYLQHRT